MSQLFIGIDSGTQSTRAVLVDGATGRVLAARSAAYGILPSEVPGTKEQDPADWVRAATEVVAGVLAAAGADAAGRVAAIGISGQQHGFVPLDAEGRVIRPAKLWCDTSTAPQCDTLIARLGGLPRTIERLGNGIPPGFTASKILWMKEHEPERYARLATVLLPHDYLAFWLTGRAHMEWGDASGTALMDVRTRRWSAGGGGGDWPRAGRKAAAPRVLARAGGRRAAGHRAPVRLRTATSSCRAAATT